VRREDLRGDRSYLNLTAMRCLREAKLGEKRGEKRFAGNSVLIWSALLRDGEDLKKVR